MTLKLLCVASECAPLVKTGGLADVVGALPGALAATGWEMRVLLPAYREVRAAAAGWAVVWQEAYLWGGPAGERLAGPLTERRSYPDVGLAVVQTPAPGPYYAVFGPTAGLDWVLSLLKNIKK